MAGPANTSAPVGESRTALVGKPSTAFKVPMKAVAKLLARPARELSLDEAAYCVAALHAAGHVTLCDSKRPFGPVQPTFAEDGSALIFPGKNADTQGRFTVWIRPFISFPVPGRPPRLIKLVYGPEVRYHDPETKKKPVVDPVTKKPLWYHEDVLAHLDVRTVVVLYHLASELFDWVGAGFDVTAIVHAGFSAQTPLRAKNDEGVLTFRDSHKYGRAIDFNGFLHDAVGGEQALLVGKHWGAVPPPGNPARRTRDGEPLGTSDLWPTLDRATGWNWTRLEWRKNEKLGENKEAVAKAGAPTYTKSFFRFQPLLDDAGAPQEQRLAGRAWRKIYDLFVRHCTVNDDRPYEDDPAKRGMGTSATDPATDGSVLHPDHASPEMRHNHYSHIHAQIGRGYGYEFPSYEAWDADLRNVPKDANRLDARRAPSAANPKPRGWPGDAKRPGPPVIGTLAHRGLDEPIPIEKA